MPAGIRLFQMSAAKRAEPAICGGVFFRGPLRGWVRGAHEGIGKTP